MKFFLRDPGGFFLASQPPEAPSFNPFIEQTEPITFPYQTFKAVCAAAAEKKQDVLLKWVQTELFFY